jgi:hypothetical protein
MSTKWKVITPVSIEPITLSAAKAYLRVDFDDDNLTIASLISRARSEAETITGRAMATQQIQVVETIERPTGGVLSGPIEPGPNWYIFNEQLGANPFGPAPFYFDLPMPPVQSAQTMTVQTKITAFDTWTNFTITPPATWLDDTSEPARFYFQVPVTANFWKFTYYAGYDFVQSYSIPQDLMQPMLELVGYWYQYREAAGDVAQLQQITNKLLAKRVSWV